MAFNTGPELEAARQARIDEEKRQEAEMTTESKNTNEGTTPSEGTPKTQSTIRLRIDRLPTMKTVAGDRKLLLVSGMRLSPEDGSDQGYMVVKVWKNAGLKAESIIKDRLEKNQTVTMDFHGDLAVDSWTQKPALSANRFDMVGEGQQAQSQQSQSQVGQTQESKRRQPARARQGKQRNTNAQPRAKGERREFDLEIVVTAFIDHKVSSKGEEVAEIAGIQKAKWETMSQEDREKESEMFRVVLKGDMAANYQKIEAASDGVPPSYYNTEDPVVVSAKGHWERIPGERESHRGIDAQYKEFVFHPKELNITYGPNLIQEQAKPVQTEDAPKIETPVKARTSEPELAL